MKGKNVLKHKDLGVINEMFTQGYKAEEISKYLNQKNKHRMYYLSGVTLQAYKNNFLNLSKEELKNKRTELLSSGNTRDANAIDTFTATKEFTEAKQKQTLAVQRVELEIVNTLENFKSIQDKVLERINLIETQTKDEQGNAIYKPRNEEILEKYLGRLESMTNSFAKVYADVKKQQAQNGTNTQISITMSEVNKYADVFKSVIQKILIRLDPALINDFIQIYTDEVNKMEPQANGEGESKVNISINNGQNISIMTNMANDLPVETPKSENFIEAEAKDVTGENK